MNTDRWLSVAICVLYTALAVAASAGCFRLLVFLVTGR